MRRVLMLLLLCMSAASADPGIGIVRDRRGNIFYTDLKQVWKIAPNGVKTVAVPNVHTHELCLDAEDNLYGEHLWYESTTVENWGHYVWKFTAAGNLEIVIPRSPGFRQNYSFVRDHRGNMYWVERGATTIIHQRAPNAAPREFVRTNAFRQVGRMIVGEDGDIYLLDDGDLRSISASGAVRTLARNLKERRGLELVFGDSHNLMGLWRDAAKNVYVAVAGGRMVKKIDASGAIQVVAHSVAPWYPTSGLCAPNGELWLLEYSDNNETRVRLLRADGSEKFY